MFSTFISFHVKITTLCGYTNCTKLTNTSLWQFNVFLKQIPLQNSLFLLRTPKYEEDKIDNAT